VKRIPREIEEMGEEPMAAEQRDHEAKLVVAILFTELARGIRFVLLLLVLLWWLRPLVLALAGWIGRQ
jgi:hypothetical protein